jgi:polyhydroxybutyrate depolymerase
MKGRWLTCLVLAACGHEVPAVQPDAADVDAAIQPDAGTCGVRTGQRGKTERTIRAGGMDRTYIVYLPSGADPQQPIPLVYVHHGYSMSAQAMFDITGYTALADAEHIAVAFPDGQAGPDVYAPPWNVGSGVCPASGGVPPNASGNDFALLDAIRDDISADQCIDTDHVFVTGFSMGGYFSHHAGCERPDIAAIAPHSGGAHALDDCPSQRKPVIIFHGTADNIVPNYCSDPTVLQPFGVTASATAWAKKNGCATTVKRTDVKGGSCAYYDDCPADGQVAICTFTAMGHCWAGGKGASVYACGLYEDATQLEWNFFKQHAW